jgi:hypothetical protein
MKAWPRVVAGLRYLIENPAIAKQLVNNGESYFDTPERERLHWERQLAAVEDSHIFEFDDDTVRLMELTDCEPHDVQLPFPLVFLDCSFNVNAAQVQNRYAGILLYQYEPQTADEAVSPSPINRGKYTVPSPLYPTVARATGARITEPHLSAVSFIREPGKPYVVDTMFPISQDPRELYGRFLGVDPKNIQMGRYGSREWKALRNISLNFLDLLNTPDAYLVPLRRGAKNQERRKREGKPALPPSDVVYLRPSIRRYIDGLKVKGQWNVSYRFWIRGHLRHYRAERYRQIIAHDQERADAEDSETRVGKCPTCFGVEFIKPYIKGRGLLIKKRYRKAGA